MDNREISIQLRPKTLADFIGQENITNKLKVYLYSAKKRKSTMDHLLFYGPPGLGKTSLAHVIANEVNAKIYSVSAPSIETVQEIVEIIAQLNKNDILFIDEIHRLDKKIEELLYSVIEDFKLNISYKSEDSTKVLSLNLPPFTVIGATTKISAISKPLRDRFGITFKFEYYKADELGEILKNNLEKFDLKIEEKAIYTIAKRSRNTPRILNILLKRLYDFSIYNALKALKESDVLSYFDFIGIDELGLNETDYEILKVFYNKFKDTPTSLEVIAEYINEDYNDIKTMNEPFLVFLGLIDRTKRGRKLTEKGLEHCKRIFTI